MSPPCGMAVRVPISRDASLASTQSRWEYSPHRDQVFFGRVLRGRRATMSALISQLFAAWLGGSACRRRLSHDNGGHSRANDRTVIDREIIAVQECFGVEHSAHTTPWIRSEPTMGHTSRSTEQHCPCRVSSPDITQASAPVHRTHFW